MVKGQVTLFFDRIRAVTGATARSAPGKTLAVAASALALAGTLKEIGNGMSIAGQPAQVVVGIAALCVVIAAAWFVAETLRAAFKIQLAGQVGDADIEDEEPKPPYFCHIIDTVEGARALTLNVASKVFPDSSIPLNVVEAAQEKNNRRLIALVERTTNRTVGWATIWPVTPEAGIAVETGAKPDDELELEDLLPGDENAQARYIVILAVGLLPAYRNLPGGHLLRTLGRTLLWHLHDEFYGSDSDKALKVLAIGDTPAGRRMCERLGLRPNGAHARFAKVADPKPVYSASLTQQHLRDQIAANFP